MSQTPRHIDGDTFELRNDPAPGRRGEFQLSVPPADPKKQGVLFAGLDCLPGQLDLFQTDGYDE